MLTKQRLVKIKSLLHKNGRDEFDKFIVEGWKIVEEAANAGKEIDIVIYDPERVENVNLLSKLEHIAKEIYPAKAKEVDSISDAVTSQGIIAVLPRYSKNTSIVSLIQEPSALIVVLDGIQDPGNLGTIIRTCDWFGVDALIIGRNAVDLYNPKVVRSSMGSMFHIPILDGTFIHSFLNICHDAKFTIYSSELGDSESIRKIKFAKKSIVIIGSESHGVSPEFSAMADRKILIPKFGNAESLNAAIACGVILSHIRL